MSKEYTPLVIAKSFTKQYYEIIHKKPQQLYRFYKEESNFFHGDENQSTETISGTDNIREKVEQLNLLGALVDLTNGSVDAQRSDNNAVFLVVTGKFTLPGKTARPFVQSFFLVGQNSTPDAQPSYYVRNSVFRLFGEETAPVPHTHESASVTTAVFEEKATEDPVKEAPLVVESHSQVSSEEDDNFKSHVVAESHHVDHLDDSTVTSEPDYVNVSVKDHEEESAKVESHAPEVEQHAPEPVVVKEKPKPSSWAALVGGGATSTVEPETEAPKPKKVVAAKKEAEVERAAPSQATAKSSDKVPLLTIYVSQLPESVVEADIRSLFETFGEIKKIDVNPAKGFAFVDFADASAVKNAIAKKASGYFTIGDASIQIEERVTKGVGNKGGSSNRAGRGAAGGNSGGARQQKAGNSSSGGKSDNKAGNNNKDNNHRNSGNKAAGSTKQGNALAK